MESVNVLDKEIMSSYKKYLFDSVMFDCPTNKYTKSYPNQARTSIMQRLEANISCPKDIMTVESKFGLYLTYNGRLGKQFATSLVMKLKCTLKENVNVTVKYRTSEISIFLLY